MTHPGELVMRQYLAEEPIDASATAHLKDCGNCGAALERLRAEQRAFEQDIPFERFAAGVEKAVRVQQRPVPTRNPNVRVALALAACLVALAGGQLLFGGSAGDSGTTRIKGGGAVEFVVAGTQGQRQAAPLETLGVGDRLRIGVTDARYVTALSIDEGGEVTTLYSEALTGPGKVWLPESIEFTGRGREHVVVVLSDEAIAVESLSRQLRDRFTQTRDLDQLGTLDVTGLQVHRTFLKP